MSIRHVFANIEQYSLPDENIVFTKKVQKYILIQNITTRIFEIMNEAASENAIARDFEVEEDVADTSAEFNLEDTINNFKRIYGENGVEGVLHKRNGISLAKLKKIAAHFGMKQSIQKEVFIGALNAKIHSMQALDAIQSTQSSQSNTAIFRRDKNTIPRILNILTTYPEGLLRTRSRANWMDLQNRNTYANAEIWVDVANNFNDRNFNSGGLVDNHENLIIEGVNPEQPNKSIACITSDHCYNFFGKFRKFIRHYTKILQLQVNTMVTTFGHTQRAG